MNKPRIVIIIASVRDGRASDRVGRFFLQQLIAAGKDAEIADLKEYDFPLFKERLRFLKTPGEKVQRFAEAIRSADGVLIVTPEYNGGYPAALKNVTDLLYEEWKRKPIAICTVSAGAFAGSQVITSLLFTLWKIGAWVVPAMCPVPKVETTFTQDGRTEDQMMIKRAAAFLDELFVVMDARRSLAPQQ